MRLLTLLFCVGILFSSCGKDDLSADQVVEVLDDCRKTPLDNAQDITKNLKGKWKLMGYGCGFCAAHNTPVAEIVFTEKDGKITYKDDFEEFELTFTWRIEEGTNVLNAKAFVLKAEPFHNALRMDVFCDDYMASDDRPVDGQMFLYRKQ